MIKPLPQTSPPLSQAVRVRVTGMLALAAAIAYVCRTSLAVAEKTIRTELDLSEATMGLLLGPAFFWPYALAQIPGGWLGETIGARRNLPLVSVAWSIATAAFGIAQGAAVLIAGRITVGLAQAGLFPCAAATVSRWHPPAERALASGTLGAAMSIGAASGAAMTGELLQVMSWRSIFLLYAVPGVIWSVVFYRWFRNTPELHPAVSAGERSLIEQSEQTTASLETSDEGFEKASQQGLEHHDAEHAADLAKPAEKNEPRAVEANRATVWAELLAQPSLWLICAQQFFRAAGYAFFTSWFATYLQETRGVSTAKSGWLLTVPLLATVAGSLTGGMVSDFLLGRTRSLWISRSLLAGSSLGVCGWLVFAAWFIESAELATLLIGAGAFFAALAGPCAYASTMDLGGKQVTQFFAMMNMIGNFGAGLIPLLVPWFRLWVDGSPDLLELSQGNSWNAVLLLFCVLYFAGSGCWLVLRPRPATPNQQGPSVS